MDKILESIEMVNIKINGVVWGAFGLILLVGTGIIVTALTKFFQVSHIGLWFKQTLGSLFNRDVIKHSREKGSISPFQALCTALKVLARENFAHLAPSKLYVVLEYSHPPLSQRIAAVEKEMEQVK